ncbi:MAG TPA: glycosyltransferase family 4 protein [Solirubrobacteraceae bacterium]|nr:glycosyltransferase family 4 protein [Solirubrobacteraceae bacterium]
MSTEQVRATERPHETERPGADGPGTLGRGALDASWRSATERAQEAVLPAGEVVVSCNAPFGGGGLGRHLEEIVEALRRRGQEPACICDTARPPFAAAAPSELRLRLLTSAAMPLARVSPGWRVWRMRASYDADAARRLPAADHLIAFNRQSLTQFHAARRGGYRSVAMMTGTPHVRHVARRHAQALRQYPLERSFGTHVLARYLTEYECADRIYCASRYTIESFLAQGVPARKLALLPMTPHPRYSPLPEVAGVGETGIAGMADVEQVPEVEAARAAKRKEFGIVYIGSLSVAKGVPLLIDAVRRLPFDDIRLTLVGGWKARGVRRFIEAARAADPRIAVVPGDPLPHLRRARLCVHPSYEDGFAYAPAEAMACGVPVLVSADTGMRDLIEPGVTGLILPTGELSALTEAIEAAYRGEILG